MGQAGTCRASLRSVQEVGPIRNQIDPSPPWIKGQFTIFHVKGAKEFQVTFLKGIEYLPQSLIF